MNQPAPRLGLALSGGAARGAYQMGIWQALRELGWEKNIVVVAGASVGAINGALLVQGSWEQALALWREADPVDAFDCLRENRGSSYWALLPDGLRHGGIRVEGLKTLLRQSLTEEAIRQSPIDFGLVVYNRSLRKGQAFYKNTIPTGLLVEYIIASASFPAFQPHSINGEQFIDGGIYKILPVDLAFERGPLDLVIGIDVAEASRFMPEMWRLQQRFGEKLVYWRPTQRLPNPLNFSRAARSKQLELGYRDGMEGLAPLLAARQWDRVG